MAVDSLVYHRRLGLAARALDSQSCGPRFDVTKWATTYYSVSGVQSLTLRTYLALLMFLSWTILVYITQCMASWSIPWCNTYLYASPGCNYSVCTLFPNAARRVNHLDLKKEKNEKYIFFFNFPPPPLQRCYRVRGGGMSKMGNTTGADLRLFGSA
jgi:hypothetical protein